VAAAVVAGSSFPHLQIDPCEYNINFFFNDYSRSFVTKFRHHGTKGDEEGQGEAPKGASLGAGGDRRSDRRPDRQRA
jgi:hypothetical protein